MDIQRCFEILELDRNASLDEAKQAYKDLVSIWHPDRFSNNSRLKRKAEEKLKEINTAYERVKSYLSSESKGEAEPYKTHARTEAGDRTEAIAESATRFVLTALSYLSGAARRFMARVDEVNMKADKEETKPRIREEKGRGAGRGPNGRKDRD